MKSHRFVKNSLYEYHRGELAEQDRRDVEAHLAGCADCRSEFEAVRDSTLLLDRYGKRPSEQRGELYWQQFAIKVDRRIETEHEEEAAPSIVRQLLDSFVLHRKPFGIGFASALTLMMIAFGVWNVWFKESPSQQTLSGLTAQESSGVQPAGVRNISVETRAQDYLEQSKVLLIGLMNSDPKSLSSSAPVLQREREISRKLVSESVFLTSSLNDPSQRRLKELVSDLQLILVQIANLGTERDVPGVEIIKGGIEHKDIIFKINLEEIHRTTTSAGKAGGTAKKTI
jgi:hypothetical protein